jgi:hypothetical protein
MITFFSCPRDFRGEFDVIQRNAICSWPGDTLLLAEPGTNVREVAIKMRLPSASIDVNDRGTPLVNDIFYQGFKYAEGELTCYVNSDIIILPPFAEAAELCAQTFDEFLMIGQRTDLNWPEGGGHARLNFASDWQEVVRDSIEERGSLHPTSGIDYFCSPGNIWGDIPPFALGRYAWDNWLVATPLRSGIPVVDATEYVTVVHQNHGERNPFHSPEAEKNREMMGDRLAGVGQANWKITSEGEIEKK